MIRLMSLLAIALIVDIVFMGPLGLRGFNIPLRRVLIALLIVLSIVEMVGQRTSTTWQVLLFLGIALFLVVWGGIVPQLTGVRLNMTLAELQPIAALFLILPFYRLFHVGGAEFYLKIVRRCTFVMALIVITVWLASNVFGAVSIGLAMREFYISMNDTDLGVYIGPLGDGSFRVMLINFILFPLMVCYYNWEDTDLGWSAFYALAIFATGTRAFLGVWALIVGVSLLRRRPALAIPLLVVSSGVAVVLMSSMQRLRVFEVGSELAETSARYMQYFSLMQLYWQYPIFGAGLGANAILIRSVDAPYSYELTYVALLAKLGSVGSGIIVTTLVWWVAHLMRRTPHWTSVLTLAVAIFLMTSTNPYLINLVGMAIVAFIIALGAQERPLPAPSAVSADDGSRA